MKIFGLLLSCLPMADSSNQGARNRVYDLVVTSVDPLMGLTCLLLF